MKFLNYFVVGQVGMTYIATLKNLSILINDGGGGQVFKFHLSYELVMLIRLKNFYILCNGC